MLTRIEVGQKSPATDSLARKIIAAVRETFRLPVDSAAAVSVYTLEMDLPEGDKERIARELLADPVTERYAIDAHLAGAEPDFDFLIEVGYKPGVTDNVGRSSREGISDLLKRPLSDDDQVYTARQFRFSGKLARADAETIATKLLANPLIETCLIRSADEWRANPVLPKVSGRVAIAHNPATRAIELPEGDEALQKLSDEKVLALTIEEMRAIKAHYADPAVRARRERSGLPASPTDVELEVIAQTWSEHCKHKIFAADIEYTDDRGEKTRISSLYKTFIKAATEKVRPRAPWLKSVFTDNAGIIAFTEDWDVSMKAETHNSPSALDPYGGAMTGIVGVNRDILGSGKGSRPIFNTDVFCFASPYYDRPIPEKLHHPRRILKEVHRGVKDGGNESGIPTVNGSIVFDDRFLGKPLVFCGTGGLHPAVIGGEASWKKTIVAGDRIVMAGGRIGKDGIHGATFSSAALTEASPTSAVQIGDPITQKKLSDFLLEARDLGLYRFVTDNGAGGLSSSLGEMARESGGCKVHLEKAPLKYAGLDPWEILVSEAQERMSFAVPPENLPAFLDLARRRGVEATDLGEFSGDGRFEACFRGETVCSLDMHFLHEGNPRLSLKAKWSPPRHLEPTAASLAARDMQADAMALLSALNICSKESWVRQYDHEVQGMSVVKPFVGERGDGPSDAAVIRPLYDRKEGLAVSHGIVPRYSDIDTYHMTACALDEAVRNAVAVGARPGTLAGLDNFCWPDPVESENTPDGQYKLAQLVRSNQALYDYCVAYGLPLISGKDSMKNDFGRGKDKISVPPTLLFTVIGKLDDCAKAVTMDAKAPGDLVYVLGSTRDEMGASEYYRIVGVTGSNVPRVDAASANALYLRLHSAIAEGLVRSAHDCSDGGLFTALAEVCMAGRLGAEVDLAGLPSDGALSPVAKMFSESQSRFVVTVRPSDRAAFEAALAGSPCAKIGTIADGSTLSIADGASRLFSADLDAMFGRWRRPLDLDAPEGARDAGATAPAPAARPSGPSAAAIPARSRDSGGGAAADSHPRKGAPPAAIRSRPRVAVITGYGINSDNELAHCFAMAGGDPLRVHINDLIARKPALSDFDIIAVPGGFSFGDHIASGRVFANKLKAHLAEELARAAGRKTPMIGICNGFQVLVKLGLLPGDGAPAESGRFIQTATLTYNDSGRFEDRWCHLAGEAGSRCLWTRGIGRIYLPVRHGEGKFIPRDAEHLASLERNGQISLRYCSAAGGAPAGYPENPNGSTGNIAGICSADGLIFGLMPHPEAHMLATNHPQWQKLGLDGEGEGVRIFRNAVEAVRG